MLRETRFRWRLRVTDRYPGANDSSVDPALRFRSKLGILADDGIAGRFSDPTSQMAGFACPDEGPPPRSSAARKFAEAGSFSVEASGSRRGPSCHREKGEWRTGSSMWGNLQREFVVLAEKNVSRATSCSSNSPDGAQWLSIQEGWMPFHEGIIVSPTSIRVRATHDRRASQHKTLSDGER